MNTKTFGTVAACIAGLATLLCMLAVALVLPTPVVIMMIVGAALLLASAGVLIGATVAVQKKSAA